MSKDVKNTEEDVSKTDNTEIKVDKKTKKAKTTKSKSTTKKTKDDKSEPDYKKHRDRVKTKFFESLGVGWFDYEILELLFFFSIPRIDTKPLAKQLIAEFGSLARVIDADRDKLMSYPGVGKVTTILIKLIKNIIKIYHDDKIEHLSKTVFDDNKKIGEFFKDKLYTYTDEVVYVMFLDNASKMISCNLISVGDLANVPLNNKTIIEKALMYKATSIAIAHNHPSGDSIPSESDVMATRNLRSDLKVINVKLIDHIIVTPTDYLVMSNGNYI